MRHPELARGHLPSQPAERSYFSVVPKRRRRNGALRPGTARHRLPFRQPQPGGGAGLQRHGGLHRRKISGRRLPHNGHRSPSAPARSPSTNFSPATWCSSTPLLYSHMGITSATIASSMPRPVAGRSASSAWTTVISSRDSTAPARCLLPTDTDLPGLVRRIVSLVIRHLGFEPPASIWRRQHMPARTIASVVRGQRILTIIRNERARASMRMAAERVGSQ